MHIPTQCHGNQPNSAANSLRKAFPLGGFGLQAFIQAPLGRLGLRRLTQQRFSSRIAALWSTRSATSMARLLISSLLILCSALWQPPALAAENLTLELAQDEVFVERFAGGPNRLLWLPSEYGFQGAPEREIAAALASRGLEVWLADLHGSFFLPPGRDSLDGMPLEAIIALVQRTEPQNGRLFVMTSGRGVKPALQALRRLQAGETLERPLGGLILLHPNLAANIPVAGAPARYFPIAGATNLPIYLMQPLNSAKRWYLSNLVATLEQGGSDVYLHPLQGVSDGFQARSDATPDELKVRAALPDRLLQATRLLNAYNRKWRTPPPLDPEPPATSESIAKSAGLQPFRGDPQPPPLQARDLAGDIHRLEDYSGRVVLLNFWATWCPPCVEEIPSMGRLQARFPRAEFVILGVDIGEDAATVEAFLKEVPADFPVLLDPAGDLVQPWRIRAFPTSLLIDRQGRIRYGYYGALKWDDPAVESLVRGLLDGTDSHFLLDL